MGLEAARLFVKVDADTRGATRGLDDVSRAVDKAGRGFNVLDEIVKGSLRQLGYTITNSLLSAGRSLLDFGASAVEVGKTFEATFSGIEAILQPTNEELALLQTLAEEMGATTKFSATEAAGAIEMLGRNGLDTAQILGGALAASMSLAASTGSDLSMSADVATDAMSVFSIEASNMAGAVDLLAGATVNSKFTLDDMRLALAQGGGAAASAGVPFDEFTTIIAGIAPSFASGSDAGTSFKTFLQRLVPASGPAEEAMAELGLLAADGSNAFFDAAGNLRSMSEVSGILENALSGLSEEQKTATLSTIFGADALRAATAVAGLGTTGYNELAAAVGSVDAEDQAAIRMDNLAGKQELLASAVEGLQLKISQFLNPVILALTERATGAVNAISSFIGEIQASDDPLGTFIARVRELIVNVVQQAADAGPRLVETLRQWGAAFVAWAGRVWAELQPLLLTLIGQVFAWITQQAPPIIERIGAWAGAFFAWVINDAAPQLMLNLGALIGQVLDWIGAQIAVLVPQLAEWAAAFYRWILTVWPGMLENLLMLSSLLIAWILERVPIIAAQLRVWGEAFGAWVMAEGWPLLFDAMTTLIGMVTAWLAEQVPVIAGALGEWAVAFVSWAVPAFAQLILKLGEMVGTTVLPWIVEQAPRLAEMLLQWASAFAGWVLTAAWPALQTALGEFWTNILGWITGRSEQIKEGMLVFGHNIVAGVREGIAQKWDEFTAWLRDKFSGLPGPIKQALGIASPSQVMADEVGAPIIQGVEAGMEAQSGSMIEMMRQLMGGPNQSTGLYAAAAGAGNYFHTIGGWLVERLLAGMRETWQQVVQFFNAELADLFGDVDTMPAEEQGRNASRAFAEGMRKEWNAQRGGLYDMFTESSDVMSGGAVSAFNAAAQLANTLPRIVEAFRSMGGRLDELYQIGADVMGALYDGMQEGLVAIEDDAGRIGAAIIDAMMTAWGEQQGGIFDRAAAMGQGMVDALATAFDGAGLVGAGESYVDGIITGIDNREAALMERINALAAAMVGGLQSSLEISSPSRLMAAQVGAPIAEGIAAGITAAKPAIDMALGAATAPPAMTGAGGTTINNTYNTTNNLSVAPVPTTNLSNELDMMAARRR
jgi:TP901 family phage tail tape measure protein